MTRSPSAVEAEASHDTEATMPRVCAPYSRGTAALGLEGGGGLCVSRRILRSRRVSVLSCVIVPKLIS